MVIHPRKESNEEGFVATRNAHGGGFTAWKNQRVERVVNMVGAPTFHDVDLNPEFLGRKKGFSVLVASTLKHGQTHTEHGAGSMPFPISPTLVPCPPRDRLSKHFKDCQHLVEP